MSEAPQATPGTNVSSPAPVTAGVPARGQGRSVLERTETWSKIVAGPGHAPELLALAAVQTLGPRAQEWSRRTREAYPRADAAGLARLATKQFTRFGGLGGVFGAAAGSYAPIALLGSAAVTQAELALHLAAAYGMDPTHPDRAADLLVISRVHATREEAVEALAIARRPAYDQEDGAGAALLRLARMVATRTSGWGAVRLVGRYFPGTGVLAAVLAGTASAEAAAARANGYYRAAAARTTAS